MTLITEKLARELNFPLQEGVVFLGLIYPDEDPSFAIAYKSLYGVAGFVERMEPHEFLVLTALDEDPDALREAVMDISGRTH